MRKIDISLPQTRASELSDGTPVLVIPSIYVELDSPLVDSYVLVWIVRERSEESGDPREWRYPLAADFTPELALEAASIEMLVRSRQHLPGGIGLARIQRYVAIELAKMANGNVNGATACSLFPTLSAARAGFELLVAKRVSDGTWRGPLYLFDRKASTVLDSTLPQAVGAVHGAALARKWIRGRRGSWTEEDTNAQKSVLPSNGPAGVVFAGATTVVPTGVQSAIDQLVSWANGGTSNRDVLQQVTGYLLQEDLLDHDDLFEGLSPHEIPREGELAKLLDDEEVRSFLGLEVESPIGDAERVRYYSEHIIAAHFGSEKTSTFGCVTLIATDARRCILPFKVEGAMMSSDVSYEWFEPARDREAVISILESKQWIVDIDRWRSKSHLERRRFFAERVEDHSDS